VARTVHWTPSTSTVESAMRWRSGRQSSNVEDRRGMRVGLAGGGIGTVILVVVAMILGVDPGDIIQQQPPSEPGAETTGPGSTTAADDTMKQMVSAVLASTEDTWSPIFRNANESYREPTLVLFSGAVQSACGYAQAAVGPFYCPRDEKVYIDLSFYRELRDRFGAPGDFAQAYVVAHEIGHHVQNQLGLLGGGAAGPPSNERSVRQELQADCFAGVWGYHARVEQGLIEPGDLEEALNAAAAIGDDRRQRETQGQITPETFTHGSSAQRVQWFRNGYESGDPERCDTSGVV
jgi:predicted metalloprotease